MKNKKLIVAMLLSMIMLLLPTQAFAYSIDKTYSLESYQGSPYRANNNYIIIHEVGVDNSPAINNAIYMKRNWMNANTAYIVGDGGKVYQVGKPGYIQYGAGSYANSNSPVQIELARTWDKATFEKDYKAYVDLIRDSAKIYGIPLTLDTAYNNRGVKSHLWVTQNIWGDHVDPYGYLSRWGVTKEKLAKDIANGIGGNTGTVKPPVKPEKPSNNGFKYKVGDTVKFGGVYLDSTNASNAKGVKYISSSGLVKNSGKITKAIKVNGKSVYLIDGGFGWINDGDVVTNTQPKPPVSDSGWKSENGTFVSNTTINIRTGASTSSPSTGYNYTAGQSVRYNAYKVDTNGYVWIRYTSYSGATRYMATGQSANGLRISYWGYFY